MVAGEARCLVSQILFPGTGALAILHPLRPAAAQKQDPAFSCLLGSSPSSYPWMPFKCQSIPGN